SVTVHVTVVVPTAYGDVPSLVVVATPQLSCVVGLPSDPMAAEQLPPSLFAVTVAGAVIVGGCISVTVYVPVVVPTAYGDVPSLVVVAIPQLSCVVGLPSDPMAAEQLPASL